MKKKLAARADGIFQQGLALHRQSRLDDAQIFYGQALQLHPMHFGATYLLGTIALHKNDPDQALELLGRAVKIDPRNADAHNDLGKAQFRLNRYEAAVSSFDKALAFKEKNPEAHNNRGAALYALKQYEAAIDSHDRAIALKADFAAAFYNRGNALAALTRYEAALASYDQAIFLKTDYADAHNNRGKVLYELQRYESAIAAHDAAIAFKPDLAVAYHNRGNALLALKNSLAAIEDYDRAIFIDPQIAEAHHYRGEALHELKRHAEAVESYTKALALKQDLRFLRGARLMAKLQAADWNGMEADIADVAAGLERGQAESAPFIVFALSDSPRLQRKAAEIWVREECPLNRELPAIPTRASGGRIRIGYFSGDYHDHAVSILTAQLFELHDRSRFEVIGFSFGKSTNDAVRKRVEAAFDRFIDVRDQSAREVAVLARHLQIDIAVDLGGFTQSGRPEIFALRAAPLQVSYLGYSGTMGADYVDYLVGDRWVTPEQFQGSYCEKIIYMPDAYLVNDSQREIADRSFGREELGLPPVGFVFCCFNNGYKIGPAVFDSWMRILRRVQASVLWLSNNDPTAVGNLRREAERRGVSADRLIFADRMPLLSEHLARQRAADLFLDTLPYNAHTTASDALWAGLPLLTCTGESFAGRVAASLLNAIGLPELVTSTRADYERLAIDLAEDPERLAGIRQKLAGNRLTMPLFDTRRFARNLEAAYSKIYERYLAGLPADHIVIKPD